MVNYNNIFLQKTGQLEVNNPWDNTKIDGFLDNAAFIVSRDYATPWIDFGAVPENYKYAVTVFSAIEYWWAKTGENALKYDQTVGMGTTQTSGTLFDKSIRMIRELNQELESLGLVDEGSGDIIMGDLVIRSKDTGYLVPRANDPNGDWTS
jgi:hypothetical protein